MFALPIKMLPKKGPNGEILNSMEEENGVGDSDSGSQECFLAFARVFSGVLSMGQKIYVLSSLYDPLKSESMHKHVQEGEIQSLYMMMGQGLKPVSCVRAGNVAAIRGLGQNILKSATLSSTKSCWPFSSLIFQVAPSLRVAIEPSDPADMGALMKGLRLLNRADPFVEITVSSRGEQVLAAAGEVHLERCIKDLKERFARVSLEVSPPLVSFKETIEGDDSNAIDTLKKVLSGGFDYVERTTPNGRCVVRVQVIKLPSALTKVLDENAGFFVHIFEGKLGLRTPSMAKHRKDESAKDGDQTQDSVAMLRKQLLTAIESEICQETDKEKFEKHRALWVEFLQRIWALGPRQVGPNILLVPYLREGEERPEHACVLIKGSPHVSEKLGFIDSSKAVSSVEEASERELRSLSMEAESLASSVVSGFQLATQIGPLCDEPMWGLAFLVEGSVVPHRNQSDNSDQIQLPDQYGIFTGQVMTAVKEACRAAVLSRKPRIVEAMYFCELTTPTECLGAMYAVLARRRARVLKEEMQEGSALFTVHAYVPVSESFGFADELRRWTSGGSSALLLLSHWEALHEDPFFVPKTEEEIEEFGDGSSVLPNTARKLIDGVRRRKGLPVEEKVVQHATKQRTLARKV
ncbi:hypothetical protein AMTR_s00004p00150000 [Amborella trichopoda]|uniref:Elongation factor-like 1 n=2 Tax=Amborella trichopoda TaxID=13333 RepID=W1NE41_AMBTC|nr:hypothetical protein AMTR_s00004p00150000 [Amborella trichopoda]